MFVLLLAVTGFLLNHTSEWSLDARILSSPMLLRWYGLESDADRPGFSADDIWLAQVDSDLYMGAKQLLSCYGDLRGAVSLGSDGPQMRQSSDKHSQQGNRERQVAIACSEELILVSRDGALLERMGAPQGLPGNVERLGKMTLEDGAEKLLLAVDTGIYWADPDVLAWTLIPADKITSKVAQWSGPTTLPEEIHAVLSRGEAERGITLERLLLDIHSGRVLGIWGVYLVDLMAFLFVVVASTGIVMWLRSGAREHR